MSATAIDAQCLQATTDSLAGLSMRRRESVGEAFIGIAQLERVDQLRAEQQKVEARKKAAETKRTRQEETRRKILVGAVVLAKLEGGSYPEAAFTAMMDAALTRNEDRKLFGLAVVEDAVQTGTTPDAKSAQEQTGG